jgi:hypothetical protein
VPGLPGLPGLPLPRLQLDVPNTGALTFGTADGPAPPATSGVDYGAPSRTLLTCSAATTSFTVTVPITGDTIDELDEKFTLSASGALVPEGPVSGSTATTIVDDDVGIFDEETGGLSTVSLPKTVKVAEGNRGTRNVLFDVGLSTPAIVPIEVKWKTANFTAKKADYKAASGKVVFLTGQRAKTVPVEVKGDKRDEPDEAFAVTLSDPVAVALGNKGAFGVIEDDDGPKVKIGKPWVRGKRLVTKVSCPDSASRCKGRLVGKAGYLKLGKKRFNLAKGASKNLKLKMSKAARAELGDHALPAKLKATASDASGDKRVTTRKARLKQRQ